MLEKRARRGGGRGSGFSDNWDAPGTLKAQMAFEIIWFALILATIVNLIKGFRNVPSRERQPYILLLISAILLDIGLIMDAIAIRISDTLDYSPYIALASIIRLLWQQPTLLITMAAMWVLDKRSKLITYGGGTAGTPYAGQSWKFVVDWIVVGFGLLFLVLAIIVNAAGFTLYWNDTIDTFQYRHMVDAQNGLNYTFHAFYFILTIIFVITIFMLNSSFKRQMGRSDAVVNLMLIWVLPPLVIRALWALVDLIYTGIKTSGVTFFTLEERLALELAGVIISGACWFILLCGLVKTTMAPGAWDWPHIHNPQGQQQPPMGYYNGGGVPPPYPPQPMQPGYYAPPGAPPPPQQGWWGQNPPMQTPQDMQKQVYTPPHAQT